MSLHCTHLHKKKDQSNNNNNNKNKNRVGTTHQAFSLFFSFSLFFFHPKWKPEKWLTSKSSFSAWTRSLIRDLDGRPALLLLLLLFVCLLCCCCCPSSSSSSSLLSSSSSSFFCFCCCCFVGVLWEEKSRRAAWSGSSSLGGRGWFMCTGAWK